MSSFNQFPNSYDMGAQRGQSVPGMSQIGNVDVNHRPIITNADGSKSSIFSMTVPVDASGEPVKWGSPKAAGYALVPSIANGKFLSFNGKMPTTQGGMRQLEAAATDYYRKTRQHLGIFNSPSEADEYATLNHDYGNNGTAARVYAPSPTLAARAAYIQQSQTAQPSPAITAPINLSNLIALQNILK
jgi:hypothetical protein